MINAIKDIGEYIQENNNVGEEDLVESLVNKLEGDVLTEILNINIKSNGEIEVYSEEFYKKIALKALFYQAGNGSAGGAFRADFFKEDEKEKFNKKIKQALAYCYVEKYYEQVKGIVYKRIKEYGKNFIAVILVDEKYPYELFKDKFMDKMYSTMYKGLKGTHTCHFCGKEGEVFNTITYKFYTNDKEVYGNVNESDKSGVVMCKKCLNSVLIGKRYVEEMLTTYWMGKNVMFIPHSFNKNIKNIYEKSYITDKGKKNFISQIALNEKEVLKKLGEGNTETDIIFFDKDANKTFYIYETIKSMLPSRFTKIAGLLEKYKIKLFSVIIYSTALKELEKDTKKNDSKEDDKEKGVKTTEKEKLRMINTIFTGRKFSRNIFFNRVMIVYKYNYFNKKDEVKFTINNIGKVYNFLVDCGCLEGGFNVMKKYVDYEALFNDNQNYFNSNEKKAWFLIGMAYSYINYKIKDSSKDEEGKIADRSSLDKNFFFARKFDFKDFIYFSNLLNDKIIKYKINGKRAKDILIEGKQFMAKKEEKLSTDEAKYIFFWGMDSFFEKGNKNDDNLEENKEENKNG